jgi:hypothetical protein
MTRAIVNQIPKDAQNSLINGAFDVWQRISNGTTIPNATSAYIADRWYVKNLLGTNGVITCSRVAGVNTGSKYGANVQITTAPTAAQVNGCEFYQTLENISSLPFYNQNGTFSIYIKALGNVNLVGLQFFYATTETKVTNSIGAEVAVSVNSSSFTLGQIIGQALGTAWTTSGVVGVRIRIIGVSAGNAYDLNNGFIVEQAMLTTGSSLPVFSRAGKNIAGEINLCYRYGWLAFDPVIIGTGQRVGFPCVNIGNTDALANLWFPVLMRTSPIMVASAGSTFGCKGGGGGQNQCSSVTLNGVTTNMAEVDAKASLSTSYYVVLEPATGTYNAYMFFDAEI